MSELGWRRVTEDPDDEDYIYCRPGGAMIGRVYFVASTNARHKNDEA